MSKTLSGTYTISGYTLSAASQGVLNPVTVTGSIDLGAGLIPAALYAQGPNSWSITNQGSITGDSVAGIELGASGTVINSGFLSGHLGVAIQAGPASVDNGGTILAVNAGTSASANQAIGVLLSAGGYVSNQGTGLITGQGAGVDILGGAGTVVNAGLIRGSAYDGVYLAGGSVTNMTGAVITGGSIATGGSIGTAGSVATSGWGVVSRGGGSLFNAGEVTGDGQGGAFLGGGTATNQGTITGAWGIAMSGALGSVINSGVLDGTVQSGVFLAGGGVSNAPGGQIVGVSGVVIRGAAGTVANSGSIGATSPAGYGVYLASGFANRLIATPGAVFTGSVDGGNSIGATAVSTLEFGAGTQQGTVSGLGTQFINFEQTTLDPGASWALTGENSVVSGATLANQGSLALNGALLVNGTLTGAGGVTLAGSSGIDASATVTGGGGWTGGGWTGGGALVVGGAGVGSFLVSNNGMAAPASAVFGADAGGTGSLDVTGAGAGFATSGLLTLGGAGSGELVVENQGSVQSGGTTAAGTGLDLGSVATGSGAVTVVGTKSVLSNSGEFVVGDGGLGSLAIDAGGTVMTSPGTVAGFAGMIVGNAAGGSGSAVDVSGAGSQLQVSGLLDVGDGGTASLQLSGGATVTAGSLDAANVAAAVANIGVSGAGSEFNVAGSATVADDGTGVMSVLNGATFSAASLTIGSQGDSSGAVVVSGSGSQLNLTGALNIGTANGTGDLTVGPGAAIQAQAVIQQGQVVLEGGLLDPTVQLINQGQTAGGFGTIAAGDIVDEGAIQAGGNKGSQKLLIVQGTVLGGGTLTVNGTQPGSVPAGILQINAGGTLELSGAVLNAATTTFTDNLTPQGTYTVNNSLIDVNFVDDAGVLLLDEIAGFAGTITTYQAGDRFVITGGTLSGVIVNNGDTLLVSDSGANAGPDGIDQIIFSAPVNPLGFKVVNGNTVEAQALPCFAAGTRIETADGLVAVEDLRVGDRVVLADGRAPEPIVWIGQRTVNCRAHPKPETVWPVRVRAGALGRNVPARDVYLSPDHAVFVNDVLVPVKLLVNGTSVAQVERAAVTYYHVELPGHSIILAEGLPVESYLHTGDRSDFRGGEAMRLFPDFSARLAPETALLWETRGAAPLVIAGERLSRARRLVAMQTNIGHRAPSSRAPSKSIPGGADIDPMAATDWPGCRYRPASNMDRKSTLRLPRCR